MVLAVVSLCPLPWPRELLGPPQPPQARVSQPLGNMAVKGLQAKWSSGLAGAPVWCWQAVGGSTYAGCSSTPSARSGFLTGALVLSPQHWGLGLQEPLPSPACWAPLSVQKPLEAS